MLVTGARLLEDILFELEKHKYFYQFYQNYLLFSLNKLFVAFKLLSFSRITVVILWVGFLKKFLFLKTSFSGSSCNNKFLFYR